MDRGCPTTLHRMKTNYLVHQPNLTDKTNDKSLSKQKRSSMSLAPQPYHRLPKQTQQSVINLHQL